MKFVDDELALASQKLLDTVSKNVVRLRQIRGYTQLDLALEIGLNGAAYLGRMEIRIKNHHFNLEHLAKIAEILEVDICEFFQPVEELS